MHLVLKSRLSSPAEKHRNPQDLQSSSAELVGLVLVPFSQITGCLNHDWVKTQTPPEGETRQNTQHLNRLMIENVVIALKDICFEPRWDFDTWTDTSGPSVFAFLWVNLHLSRPCWPSEPHFMRTSFQDSFVPLSASYSPCILHGSKPSRPWSAEPSGATARPRASGCSSDVWSTQKCKNVSHREADIWFMFYYPGGLDESVWRQGGKGVTVWIRAFIKLFNNYHNYHCISSPRLLCVCVCVCVRERVIYLTGQGHLHKASVRSTVHLQIERKERSAKVKKKERKSRGQDSCQAIVVSPTYQ